MNSITITSTERQAIEYAVKAGMLRALLNAEKISEQQYYDAMGALWEETAEVAA